jgi:hypothetical protein
MIQKQPDHGEALFSLAWMHLVISSALLYQLLKLSSLFQIRYTYSTAEYIPTVKLSLDVAKSRIAQ